MAYFVLGQSSPRPTFRLDASERDVSLTGERAGGHRAKNAAGTGSGVLVEAEDLRMTESLAARQPIIREGSPLFQSGLTSSLASPSRRPLTALHTTIRELP